MRFQALGQKFDVMFRYESGKDIKNKKYKDCTQTTCFVSQVDPDENMRGPQRYTVVGEGSARRNIIDPPNRSVGRKEALQKALLSCSMFTKDVRRGIWPQILGNPKIAS